MIASIVGIVVVALILGFVKEKREKEDAKMTEDSMNRVRDMFKEINFKEES
jgi:hypothetical protein